MLETSRPRMAAWVIIRSHACLTSSHFISLHDRLSILIVIKGIILSTNKYNGMIPFLQKMGPNAKRDPTPPHQYTIKNQLVIHDLNRNKKRKKKPNHAKRNERKKKTSRPSVRTNRERDKTPFPKLPLNPAIDLLRNPNGTRKPQGKD